MLVGRGLSILLVACGLTATLLGCAKRPHLHGEITVRLMADRDFAEILLSHFDVGIELTGTVVSLNVGKEVAALAGEVRRSEENDRSAITSWIASQQAQLSAYGEKHAAESRASHAKVIEQLRATTGEHADEHVLRVLLSHHNEGLTFLRQTPVEDDNLETIVDAVRRRLSDEVRLLSRRLP